VDPDNTNTPTQPFKCEDANEKLVWLRTSWSMIDPQKGAIGDGSN
jgi:hypothetical protein